MPPNDIGSSSLGNDVDKNAGTLVLRMRANDDMRRIREMHRFYDAIYNQALLDIEFVLILSRSLHELDGFIVPEPVHDCANVQEPVLISERHHLSARLALRRERQFEFNNDQQIIYAAVNQFIDAPQQQSKLHLVNGPEGTGKTTLFNAIVGNIRRTNFITLVVATSGAAALLLDGRRTAHSTFEIPLETNEISICDVTPCSDTARLIKLTSIIIWDEISMISCDVIETVNHNIQDIMRSVDPVLENIYFGGKVVVFGGDFGQVLPVIPNAKCPQIVAQCLNRSSIWRHTEVHHRHTNTRVQQAANTVDGAKLREFAEYLLRIGNGSEPPVPGTDDRNFINLYVVELNNLILDQFLGKIQEFRSANQVDDPEGQIR
ncbi:hypothetical protein INT45_008257 [Circinella minor]|uniref:ATP-dependent DNA helicase n=1 Tax=Circinella minor TaxID=1195481 RepID=A0A8H7VHF1_9FUNG|nr:hypothetical protein INT45_008257 [Circinella minor]